MQRRGGWPFREPEKRADGVWLQEFLFLEGGALVGCGQRQTAQAPPKAEGILTLRPATSQSLRGVENWSCLTRPDNYREILICSASSKWWSQRMTWGSSVPSYSPLAPKPTDKQCFWILTRLCAVLGKGWIKVCWENVLWYGANALVHCGDSVLSRAALRRVL